jgi:drug/metabolite transporter (DMT)-like permease
MERKSEVIVYLQLIIVQMIWGGAFIIGQLALAKQPVMTTLLIRNLGVSLGFILILCCSKKYRWLGLPRAALWPQRHGVVNVTGSRLAQRHGVASCLLP